MLSATFHSESARAQGGQTLYGEVKVNDSEAGNANTQDITIILYSDIGGEVARQTVTNHSRYRFTNLRSGDYELAAMVDGNEIARLRISMAAGTLSNSPYGFRQDLEFNLKSKAGSRSSVGTLSAADVYDRSAANRATFQKAQDAVGKRKFDQAITLLRQIVENDKLDFQVWTLLGTVYLEEKKPTEAEQSYLSALDARPGFTIALLDLGRLRVTEKKYADAIDPLTRAVELQPDSAEINYLLGESYIQLRKGSKAIPYLNDAARLGRPDAHLRLAWLYNAAGIKDKAAVEYAEFLKKKPDYPDRKQLEEYIKTNGKKL
jgi:tetratricopeptide (TPR) repeat protein